MSADKKKEMRQMSLLGEKSKPILWGLFISFTLSLYFVYVPFLMSRGIGFGNIFDILHFFIPLLAFSALLPTVYRKYCYDGSNQGINANLGMVVTNTVILSIAGGDRLFLNLIGFGVISVLVSIIIWPVIGGSFYGSSRFYGYRLRGEERKQRGHIILSVVVIVVILIRMLDLFFIDSDIIPIGGYIPQDVQMVQVALRVDGAGMIVGFGDAFFR